MAPSGPPRPVRTAERRRSSLQPILLLSVAVVVMLASSSHPPVADDVQEQWRLAKLRWNVIAEVEEHFFPLNRSVGYAAARVPYGTMKRRPETAFFALRLEPRSCTMARCRITAELRLGWPESVYQQVGDLLRADPDLGAAELIERITVKTLQTNDQECVDLNSLDAQLRGLDLQVKPRLRSGEQLIRSDARSIAIHIYSSTGETMTYRNDDVNHAAFKWAERGLRILRKCTARSGG